MKVLILSCNTGEGHNSAAKAIAEVLEHRETGYEIADALGFFSKEASKLICASHVRIYKTAPKLFGAGYRAAERAMSHPGTHHSAVYELLSQGAEKLYEYLVSGGFDTVICVHVFAEMIMTAVYKRFNCRSSFASGFVATDYTCSPGVSEGDMDAYFIPHADLTEEFADCGVPSEKIVVSGIPVRRCFFHSEGHCKSREILGLPAEKQVVLLACGSMGCGPMRELGGLLHDNLPDNAHLVVMCGRNTSLAAKFDGISGDAGITVLGYTHEMGLWMSAADFIITKPGGLSTTEAAAMRLPMIFVNAVPGCETHNLDFFIDRGFAATRSTPFGISTLAASWAAFPEKAQSCRKLLEEGYDLDGASCICNYFESFSRTGRVGG